MYLKIFQWAYIHTCTKNLATYLILTMWTISEERLPFPPKKTENRLIFVSFFHNHCDGQAKFGTQWESLSSKVSLNPVMVSSLSLISSLKLFFVSISILHLPISLQVFFYSTYPFLTHHYWITCTILINRLVCGVSLHTLWRPRAHGAGCLAWCSRLPCPVSGRSQNHHSFITLGYICCMPVRSSNNLHEQKGLIKFQRNFTM